MRLLQTIALPSSTLKAYQFDDSRYGLHICTGYDTDWLYTDSETELNELIKQQCECEYFPNGY